MYSQDTLKLTLDKSIELALKFNHDIKLAQLDRDKADEQVDEAWGVSVLPTISGNVNYSYALKRGEFVIETPFFSGSFPQGTEHTLTLGATLEQPLFTGAIFLAVRVAKTYAEIAQKMFQATQSEVIVNVKKAYYSHLLSKEVLELSKLNLELAQDNLKNTESMYTAGVVPEYDFVRAKVQVQNLIPEVQQAENAVIISANLLKLITGLELSQPVGVDDSLFFKPRENLDHEDSKQLLMERNHIIKQLQLQVSLRDDAASYEFTKHFPELYFTSNWQSQAQENDPRPFNDWRYKNSVYIGLNLKVPIFNGFQTTSKVQQAEIDLLKAREEYAKNSKILNNNLHETMLNAEQTKERVESYKATIGEAELGYDIASKRYTTGVGTQLEVVDAMVSLSRAKVNYYTAVYDYYILNSEIDKLVSADTDLFINRK
jgi:outer membrane protein